MGIDDPDDLEVIDLRGERTDTSELADSERADKSPTVWLLIGVIVVLLCTAIGSLRWSQLRVRDAWRRTDATVLRAQTAQQHVDVTVVDQRACVHDLDGRIIATYQDAQSRQLRRGELLGEIGRLTVAALRCERLTSPWPRTYLPFSSPNFF